MKTLRLINVMAAVALLVASCGDWDSDMEKARITSIGNYGEVRVYVSDGNYRLSWDQPEIYTNKGYLAVSSEETLAYDIYVTSGFGGESFKFVKKVNAQNANLTFSEVAEALGSLSNGTYGFMFCVRLSDFGNTDYAYGYSDLLQGEYLVSVYGSCGSVTGTGMYNYGETVTLTAVPYIGYVFSIWSDGSTENPRNVVVDGDIELVAFFESKNVLAKGYPGTNEWFVDGQNAIHGYVEDGKIVINVEGKGEVWDDNLEIVLHGLKNQVEGNEFLLEFDIAWEGTGDNTTGGFRICSGVDNYMPISETDPTFVPLTNVSDVWNPKYNTELIFGDDFTSGMGKRFTVGAESQHIQWGGTIGERGEKYIGIEINLAGIEDGEGIHLNGRGTFTISNMRIIINEEQVW